MFFLIQTLFLLTISWHSVLVLARCIGRVVMVTCMFVVSSWSPKLICMQQTSKTFRNLNFEIVSCRKLFFVGISFPCIQKRFHATSSILFQRSPRSLSFSRWVQSWFTCERHVSLPFINWIWKFIPNVDIRLNHSDSLFSNGFAPLHLSAENGHGELCRFLLDSKADLHAKTG